MVYKSILAIAAATLAFSTMSVSAQSIKFGDDASEYSKDGECDDRRFIGTGMASGLDTDDNMHDATDCRRCLMQA